ncbi:4-deoxy-4-formamido-L-arabinose-phosphoundecaprenol deformylase, partial [Pseudomonas oryzihabitans]|nr:4-deoxy-4-formamido-L-arabinose-phosphoundecaprenol deformylase [Pseudomonas oryzihabitans]
AEVEGIAFAEDFRVLLKAARERDIHFGTLGERLPDDPQGLPEGSVVRGSLAGRQGWLGVQQ